MPRYAYQKPRAKVYAYNYGYMNNYYKPMTHYLSKESHYPSERPGAQSLAERLKKFPMDGSIYPDKVVGYLPSVYPPAEIERQVAPCPPRMESEEAPRPTVARALMEREQYEQQHHQQYPQQYLQQYPQEHQKYHEQEPERKVVPLYLKHPYRLPVEDEQGRRRPVFDPAWFIRPWSWECIWVPPHECTVTPHFGVESCYSLITKFLRLKPLSELTCS